MSEGDKSEYLSRAAAQLKGGLLACVADTYEEFLSTFRTLLTRVAEVKSSREFSANADVYRKSRTCTLWIRSPTLYPVELRAPTVVGDKARNGIRILNVSIEPPRVKCHLGRSVQAAAPGATAG